MDQISPFKVQFYLGQMAIRLEKRAPCEELPVGGWRVTTDADHQIDCKVQSPAVLTAKPWSAARRG